MGFFMYPVTLRLAGQTYTVDQLRQTLATSITQSLSENERATLDFCHHWLNGEPDFTVNTSGSTGTPKPIQLTREQMTASARRTGATLGLQAGQQALVCLPTRYIAGRMMLVRGFVLGLDMTVVEPASDPLAAVEPTIDPLGTVAPDAHFDFTALIPLQLQTLLAGPPYYHAILNRMQAILIGGGPVSPALLAQLQAITAPIYHTYGMTETVSHIALRQLNGPQASPAFRPLLGVQIGVDERNCLNICADVTQNQVVQTNDLVDLRADGSFIWLGRWDNVINSGGVKVQVEKVEHALEQVLHALDPKALGKRRFFVGPLPDARLGETVTVVIEGTPLPAPQADAIRQHLGQMLDRYEIPRHFCYLPHLAETPTGKIDRKANLKQLLQ
jgi:o-succinylbenzoate---CoA ligase